MTRSFDKLKIITSDEMEKAEERIKVYFAEMELPESAKDERTEIAKDFYRVFANLFIVAASIVATENEISDEWQEYLIAMAVNGYNDCLENHNLLRENEKMAEHAKNAIREIMQTTFDTVNVSSERAEMIAETETNSISNFWELQDALASGYTMKTWRTMQDNKVRHTHVEADNQTIPIEDFFVVGNSEMLYPLDAENGADASEIVNCRCVCEYS